MNIIPKTAENQISEICIAAIKNAMASGELPEAEIQVFKVEIPADRKNGDYSTNAAMAHARVFKSAPIKIANTIIANMKLDGTYFSSCEAAGAGFINFRLSQGYYADILKDIEEKKETYGHSDMFSGKSALVEFVSANPTGPMHVGNARGGAMGDCLAELLSWAGYKTEREFYINDGGNQIEKFGLSLDIRYRQHFGDNIEMPEDSYHGQDITDHAENFARIYGDKYMSVSEEERRKALVDFALPLNIEGLERDLLKYKIKYDTWFHESDLHNSGAAKKVVDKLTENGYTYELDGALWFKAEQFGCDKDFVLRRSNGFYTYIVPDIAYHYNKLCERCFTMAVDILGADHHGYVPRLKAALQALDIDPERLQVVLMQMVRLVKDGEVIKASKRSGKAITLVTLLDEVPIDAARFFFNMREANTHCDFDLDLAVSQSSQNPVYYCQYAHARICSIFKKLGEKGIAYNGCSKEQALLLTENEEKELIRHLASLPLETESAAKALDPSRMTRYAMELATLFHKFYNSCRVENENADLTAARLFLCECVRQTLENVLGLLKVDAPEKM
ncbi:MAG: arginine--tRNA ligase [Oscillospiraceae bacterium]|nr:arginine--tRNA ligase [Oscillospiraceae bacterium]